MIEVHDLAKAFGKVQAVDDGFMAGTRVQVKP